MTPLKSEGVDAGVVGSPRAKKNLARGGLCPISQKLEAGVEQKLGINRLRVVR
jgi:hypothetical protein